MVIQRRIRDFRKGGGGPFEYIKKTPKAPPSKQGAEGTEGERCGEGRPPLRLGGLGKLTNFYDR